MDTNRWNWCDLGTDDECNPHLITAGCDDRGMWIYPFLDNEIYADDQQGRVILAMVAEIRKLQSLLDAKEE